MKRSNSKNKRDLTAFLYERLSRDDDLEGESYSIANQKKLLIKVAKEMGYTKIITYILITENGASLKAAGWSEQGVCGGGNWNVKSRPRNNSPNTC